MKFFVRSCLLFCLSLFISPSLWPASLSLDEKKSSATMQIDVAHGTKRSGDTLSSPNSDEETKRSKRARTDEHEHDVLLNIAQTLLPLQIEILTHIKQLEQITDEEQFKNTATKLLVIMRQVYYLWQNEQQSIKIICAHLEPYEISLLTPLKYKQPGLTVHEHLDTYVNEFFKNQTAETLKQCHFMSEEATINQMLELIAKVQKHLDWKSPFSSIDVRYDEYSAGFDTALRRHQRCAILDHIRRWLDPLLFEVESEYFDIEEKEAQKLYSFVKFCAKKIGLKFPIRISIWVKPCDDYPCECISEAHFNRINFNVKTIYKKKPDGWYRETIAHELGHALQAEQGHRYGCYGWDEEIDADAIGAFILSPQCFIDHYKIDLAKPRNTKDPVLIFYELGAYDEKEGLMVIEKCWPEEWKAFKAKTLAPCSFQKQQLLFATFLRELESEQVASGTKKRADCVYMHAPNMINIAELEHNLTQRLAKFGLKLET